MAVSLAQLQEWRDALEQARYTGVRTVRFSTGTGERETTYKSDQEMERAITDLNRRIAAAEGNPVRFMTFATSKGT
jgi:hypothetical protein